MASWLDGLIDLLYHLFGYKKVTAVSLLTSSGGTRLNAKPVTLRYKKLPAMLFTTDGTSPTVMGIATNSVYVKPGSYVFKMSFAGGGGYNPSSAQVTIAV